MDIADAQKEIAQAVKVGIHIKPVLLHLESLGFPCQDVTKDATWSNAAIVKTFGCNKTWNTIPFIEVVDVGVVIGVNKNDIVVQYTNNVQKTTI